MVPERKVAHISKLAKAIKQGEQIGIPQVPFSRGRIDLAPNDKVELFAALKEERAALAAVFIDRIVDRAFNSFYGEIGSYEQLSYPFDHLSPSTYIDMTLKHCAVQEFQELKERLDKTRPGEDHIVDSFYRYRQVLVMSRDNEFIDKSFNDIGGIMAGINTDVQTMGMTYGAINGLYLQEKKITRENAQNSELDEIVQIGRNSFSFLSSFARLNLVDSAKATDKLIIRRTPSSSGVFDIDKLELKEVEGVRFLDFKKGSGDKSFDWKKLFSRVGVPLESYQTTHCPGLISFDGKPSAIKRLWEFYLDLM